MSEAKHTPGPWVKRWNDRVTTPDDSDGSKSIAHCYSRIHDCEANARLIAAAPELLAACEAFLRAYDNADLDHDELISALEDGISQSARDAVAKATGAHP